MNEHFYWAVLGYGANDKPRVALVCDEGALPEAQGLVEQLCGRVERLPVSFHDSTPDLATIRYEVREMYLLLWGKPGAAGPGKIPGKQQQLREHSLKAMQALGLIMGGNDDDS